MTDAYGFPPDDEPKSPMWLPALGAALFVAVALWWAVTPSAQPIAPDAAPGASASVAVAAAAPPLPAQAAQPGQGAIPMGSARPSPSGMHINPALEERMRKLHEGLDPRGAGKHP